MDCLDEIILLKRNKKKAEKYNSLEKGFYIDNKIVKFQREDIENIFSIIVPEDFKIMPEEFSRIKYPSIFRPQHIYTDIDLSADIGFSLFPDNLITEGTEKTAKRMIEAIRRDNPSHEFYEIKLLPNDKGTWFSLRSHAIDCDMFNMILILKISNGILQSNFNCHIQK